MIGRHDLAVLVHGREDHQVRARAGRRRRCYLQRPEAARERDLRIVGHILAAEDHDRMLLEGRARRPIGSIIGGDVGERYATDLGGKARTERDDIHRRASLAYRLLKFPPNRVRRQPSARTLSHQCLLLRFQA
jgi:hypothetical protein